jgi:hypothetical protein
MNGVDVTDVTRNFTADDWDKLRAVGGHTYVNQRPGMGVQAVEDEIIEADVVTLVVAMVVVVAPVHLPRVWIVLLPLQMLLTLLNILLTLPPLLCNAHHLLMTVAAALVVGLDQDATID